MNLKLFIDRPVLSCCTAVLMVLLGVICLLVLPMEQYPDIAPPTVVVSARYPGAGAETVQKSVVEPLEEAINGVEHMTYLTSTAANDGSATVSVFFAQGTDADMAAVNVQNRVAKAQGQLPAEVTKTGVTTQKQQSSQLKILAVSSPDDRFDTTFLSNYMKINIVPQLQRIAGVGGVTVLGSDYAMRIWLQPQKMLAYGLVPADIAATLAEQNLEAPTGTLGQGSANTFLYTLKYRGRFKTPEEYGNLVLKALPDGRMLYLRDVADIELGAADYNIIARIDGHPGAVCMISQVAGSNANEIIEAIDRLTAELRPQLPEGLVIADLLSSKDFLDASIAEVLKTLIEAVLLVTAVVYVFLQSLRSTVIPCISIVVSLITTFALLYLVGFTINLLTLFALILVIGTVVDDAIVVVEAVQARLDRGDASAYRATAEATAGIASAIVTTSLVFMSVFIPVCFISGTAGTFYTQFGLTMALAVGVSAVNALTLSPALCALIMKPHADDGGFSARFHRAFDGAFGALVGKYRGLLVVMFRRKWIALALLVGASAGLIWLMGTTKTGLIPDEDTGVVFVSVTTPPGYTLSETDKTVRQVEAVLNDFPEVQLSAQIAGYNLMSGAPSASGGTFILKLRPWAEREDPAHGKDAVIARVFARTADVSNAQVFAFAPPMISGYGTSNSIELHVQDRHGGNVADLSARAGELIAALNRRPEVARALTTFNPRFPQYTLSVDAALCRRLQVSPADVLSAVSGYVGGSYASDINLYTKMYRVMVQARAQDRLDPDAFANIFVRASGGRMLPIGQFLTLRKIYGPETLNRFNLFSSVAVSVSPAAGYSTGDVIRAVGATAAQTLPAGYGFEYGGMTRDEAAQGNNAVYIYGLCALFVFLLLCCLYESLLIPLAVMLSVPFALAGSFLFARWAGLENNIYMQTGLIMLMGLITKTAILLVQFAAARRRDGLSVGRAALQASGERLRPILMTSICMIVGLLPLVVARGVGANGSRSLGTGVVGGMLVGTVLLLLTAPVFYTVCQTLQDRLSRHGRPRD